MSDRPLIWIGDDALCPECRAPVTTGMMAAFCPRREKCEFWPEDADTAFLDWIGGRRATPWNDDEQASLEFEGLATAATTTARPDGKEK